MPNVALIETAAPTVPPLTNVVDGWPEEQHQLKVNISGAPVESGVETTDHSVLSSEILTLTFWVSGWRGGRNPADAWGEVRRLARDREPIRVLTEWGIYEEMLIWEADAPKTNRGMRGTLKLIWINRVGVTDSELPPEATRSADVSTAAADSVAMAQDVPLQAQAATVPVQAMAAELIPLDPMSTTLVAQANAVHRTSAETLSESASLGQRLRAFAAAATSPNVPQLPPIGQLARVAGLSTRLQNEVGTLATTARALPGGAGLARQISDAQSAAGRLSRQANGAVTSVESARSRAAAIGRSGEVARGRVALPPVEPVIA